MKKTTQNFLLFIAGAMLGTAGFAQTTYNFDLNYNTDLQYPSTGNWNNHYAGDWGTTIDNFIDDQGNASTYTFAITDDFVAGNSTGSTNPDSNLGFPETATNDSYYVQDGSNPTGAITISGLNTSNVYSFEVFAARAGVSDNRETQYELVGANTEVGYLDPSSNDSESVLIENIQPDASGNIVLNVSKGPNNANGAGYAYIGAFKMIETSNLSVNKNVIEGAVSIYPNPAENGFEVAFRLNETSNLSVKLYDISGRLVSTLVNEEVAAGNFTKSWNRQDASQANLASGIYMLQISTGNSQQTKKVILK